MRAKILSIFAVSALSVSCAFAADYSKISNEGLIDLAGKVTPQDYPDYKMEIYKRVLDMKVKDAQVFYDNLCNARKKAYESMTFNQMRDYRDSVRLEIDRRLEDMTIQEGYESGLLEDRFGALREGWCDDMNRGAGARIGPRHRPRPPHLDRRPPHLDAYPPEPPRPEPRP